MCGCFETFGELILFVQSVITYRVAGLFGRDVILANFGDLM